MDATHGQQHATGGDFNKLIIFERKILSKKYGPAFDDNEQSLIRRSNEELNYLYANKNLVCKKVKTCVGW